MARTARTTVPAPVVTTDAPVDISAIIAAAVAQAVAQATAQPAPTTATTAAPVTKTATPPAPVVLNLADVTAAVTLLLTDGAYSAGKISGTKVHEGPFSTGTLGFKTYGKVTIGGNEYNLNIQATRVGTKPRKA